MAGNTSTIDLKVTGIAEIKKQLRELKGELASATDPQQMAELAEKAGELSDQLKDANERVSVFASGSPFEKTNNALGLMGSQLMSLDFEGAAESSKLFASAAKGINGDVIAKSLKGLGTVVGQVGKAFMSVGLSLLTNPIFLIAAAIAAIVAIIVLLMNKLGILKPILDAIGKVFGAIMVIIDAVVEGFKMLTDWLGLTAHAAEESAARQIAASEKTLEALERTSEKRIDSMDHEIRLAKIAGEDVAVSEAKKQKYIIETTQIRIDELAKQVKLHERLGDLEDEDLKKLKDSLSEQKKALREANQDFEALRLENKVKVEENAKKVQENAKKVWAEQKKAREEEAKDRLNALRQIQDLEISLMKDGTEKELLENKTKYQRLIEDTLANEKLLSAEKQKVIAALKEQEFIAQQAINQKQAEELSALVAQESADRKAKEDEEKAAFLARNEQAQAEEKARREKEKNDKLAEEKAFNEARLNLGGDLVKGLQGLEQLLVQAGVKTAGLQKTIALVQIASDTAKAISATIAGATAAAAAGGPAAPFLLAGYIASGIGTVLSAVASAYAALKKAPPLGGSVSGSAPSTPSTSTQAATPNVSLFGQNNNANNLTSPQSEENTNQQMVVKAVVVESDITNAQTKANKYQNLASL
jgi:hypothetical protein